jgi:Uma2 family endonuclease
MATAVQDPLLRLRHRYSVDDYYRMADVGILRPDSRVELIDGEVIEMPPIGPLHASMVTELQNRLIKAVGDAAIVRVQNPVRLGPGDEPEPDLAVVTQPAVKYRTRHPGPSDILLLIEVADNSVGLDRDLKLVRYAYTGVPEVWLVEAKAGTMTRYHEPTPNGYRGSEELQDQDEIPVPGLTNVMLSLQQLS